MRWAWLVLLAGCVTTATVRADNRMRLNALSPGMSRDTVLAVMGESADREITNPYRTESYEAQGRRFTVLYYYTDLKKRDDAITDDELTPLVLVDGRLDGWGWGYWNSLVQKYELRIR